MKVLVLSCADKALDNSAMWYALGECVDVGLRFLEKNQQKNLRAYFRTVDTEKYDRIVLDLMFKNIYKQFRFLRTLPNLVVYEEDAYLDYMPGSKWLGFFSRFYRNLPNVRVINTGAWVAEVLAKQGVDANFAPKGFDAKRLFNRELHRDIFLGFVGRLSSSAYAQRYQLLTQLAGIEPVQLLRTKAPEDYPELLNRIQCFVSADIGLQEYMAKNFEAMACGCLLLAKRQGRGEEEALGLINGLNVLLYDDLAALASHIAWARENPDEAAKIAMAGCEHVLANNEYSVLSRKVLTILEKPFESTCTAQYKWWRLW